MRPQSNQKIGNTKDHKGNPIKEKAIEKINETKLVV